MQKIYAIAEIGQAHDGSLGMAHAYIDAFANTGVSAIKFQVHMAEAESSLEECFRVPLSSQDKTRQDYWRRTAFTVDQWRELKKHCAEKDVDFIASPSSLAAVDLLEQIGVSRYKIGSGEVGNLLLLKRLRELGKPLILSTGLSSITELDDSVHLLDQGIAPLTVLQCTSAYPTEPHQWGLNMLQIYRDRWQVPVGFSDHSGNIFACLAAAVLGAAMLEFHVTFNKEMFGPDVCASLTKNQVIDLMTGVRHIQAALANPVDKSDTSHLSQIRSIFGKSLSVNRDMTVGEVIRLQDLESKKPGGFGIHPMHFEQVIGKQINKPLKKWSFLTEADMQ